MKQMFNGECRVRIGSKTYVLRPSFAALYAIWQSVGAWHVLPFSALPECVRALCDAPMFIPHKRLQEAATRMLSNILPFDWEDTYRLATGTLGLAREEFWQMTPQELQLAYEGYCINNGYEITHAAAPPGKDDLHKMMQQFPDGAGLDKVFTFPVFELR